MNNNNRKDQKPNFGIAKLVIFGVSALFLFIDVIGTDGGSAFFIILMIGAGKCAEGESISKRLTEKMRDDLSRCDNDHEHAEPTISGTPDEKRAAQLKELMRNGLIEKDEYNILMRKFGLK